MTTPTPMTDEERAELEERLRADDLLRKQILDEKEATINTSVKAMIEGDDYLALQEALNTIQANASLSGTRFEAHISGLINIMNNLEGQVQ